MSEIILLRMFCHTNLRNCFLNFGYVSCLSFITFSITQVLHDILAVVDVLSGNVTMDLLGLAQIRSASSSKLLEALDNFVKVVDCIYIKLKKKPFILSDLAIQFSNIAFAIIKDLSTRDVYFIATNTGGKVKVTITTDKTQSKITSGIEAVIKVPRQTFLLKEETLYSYQFRMPSFFLTEAQLQNINGEKTDIDLLVNSEVLSATINLRRVQNLSDPIVLTFKKSIEQKPGETVDCQFWNASIRK